MRLERSAADQIRIFVGLEIAHADNHVLRIKCRSDRRDSFGELVDEILGFVSITLSQPLDLALGLRILKAGRN